MELFKTLGFVENPFSKYSAEEELDYIDDIFITPRYYDTLFSDIKKRTSRFISGLRGSGKSALIYKLIKDLKDDNYLTVLIDNFDNIKLTKNDTNLLLLMINTIIKEYIVYLSVNPQILKSLNKAEKENLSFIITNYFTSLTKYEYEEKVSKVTKFKSKKKLASIFNAIFHKPINLLINGLVEIPSDFIRKSLNLPEADNSIQIKQYIPEINIDSPKKDKTITDMNKNYSYLKNILNELCILINKTSNGIVIFFDKIDEFKDLEGKTDKIILFLKSILNDTELLLNSNFSLVFSLWSEINKELNQNGVRLDKFKPIDISWRDKDIEEIMNKKLSYFSMDATITLDDLLPSKAKRNEILNLSKKSPRDYITILSKIYDEHTLDDKEIKYFEDEKIDLAMVEFAKKYAYYSHYPAKKGTKEDIYNVINKLLGLAMTKFSIKDYSQKYKIQPQASSSYVKIMKNYKLVDDNHENVGNTKHYDILDPKIELLINSEVKSLRL